MIIARNILALAITAILLNLTACSGQQIYGTGQAWQRNQCFKISDAQERSRCLEAADTPYYEYRRDTGVAE